MEGAARETEDQPVDIVDGVPRMETGDLGAPSVPEDEQELTEINLEFGDVDSDGEVETIE